MADIDFLPAKYREASAHRKTQCWRLIVVASFAGLIVAAAVGQYGIRLSLERDAQLVREQHAVAMAETQRLAKLELELKPLRAEAELWTFLRRPWPKTRILASLIAELPDAVTLSKLEVRAEHGNQTPMVIPTGGPNDKPNDAQAAPAERDLRRLREEGDSVQLVVLLEGTTTESIAVHSYLANLAAVGIFSRAELTSMESDGKEHQQNSQFRARLVVHPAYGDRGGPVLSPPVESTAQAPVGGPRS
jgi:Tfp pilus assembly protein PilN